MHPYSAQGQDPGFLRHVITDPQSGGFPVAMILHPAGWQARSQVAWNLSNPSNPVTMHAAAFDPAAPRVVEFLPGESFQPSAGGSLGGFFKSLFGSSSPAAPSGQVVPLLEAIQNILLPKYLPPNSGVRMVGSHVAPEHIPADPRAPQARAEGARGFVRVEIQERNGPMIHEFQALQTIVTFPGGWGGPGMVIWTLSEISRLIAPAGEFESLRPVLLRVAESLQVNPAWKHHVQNTMQGMIQNQNQMANQQINAGWEQIRLNGQASQQFIANSQAYIAQQQQRIDAMPMPTYTATSGPANPYVQRDGDPGQQTSQQEFVNAMREEHTYYNSATGSNEQFTIHADQVWTNNSGQKVGFNDPNFDPNAVSNQQWTQLNRQTPGS